MFFKIMKILIGDILDWVCDCFDEFTLVLSIIGCFDILLFIVALGCDSVFFVWACSIFLVFLFFIWIIGVIVKFFDEWSYSNGQFYSSYSTIKEYIINVFKSAKGV
jgi:hypothetical protein